MTARARDEARPALNPHLPALRRAPDGNDAGGCLRVSLGLPGLWRAFETESGGLLRLLLLWHGEMPAHSGWDLRRAQ
jgi:hypothetical protein